MCLPQLLLPEVVSDAIEAANRQYAHQAGKSAAADEESRIDVTADNVIPIGKAEWQPIESYIQQYTDWKTEYRAIRKSELTRSEKTRKIEALGPEPDIHSAISAAKGILALDGQHEQTRDAALFLLDYVSGV